MAAGKETVATAQPDPYCPMCGREVGENAVWRFDVRFCSEAHAEDYAREKAQTSISAQRSQDR